MGIDVGDQSIALKAQTFDPVSALEQVSQLQSRNLANDYTRDTMADREASVKASSQLEQATAANAQATSPIVQEQARRMRLANAMAMPQTSQEWDEAMNKAVDDGIPEAQQYVGRFSKDRQNSWVNALSAPSPGSALAAANGTAATPDGNPMEGAPGAEGGAEWAQRFASMDPKTLAATTAKVAALRQAIQAVESSADPAAEWRKQAVAMGHPEQANDPNWQQKLAQLKATVVPAYNALGAMQLQANLGIPKAQPAARLEHTAGGGITSIEGDPAHPTARTLVDSHFKPTAFADRQNAYLSLHPDDAAGALEYAAGKMPGAAAGKAMTPAAIEKYAESQSAKELNDARLNGDTIPDPVAWQQARKAEITSNLTRANSQGTGTPAAAAAASGAAPSFTSAQRQYEKQYPENPKSPAGAHDRPYYVTSPQQLEQIKAQRKARKATGTFYFVLPSGKFAQDSL